MERFHVAYDPSGSRLGYISCHDVPQVVQSGSKNMELAVLRRDRPLEVIAIRRVCVANFYSADEGVEKKMFFSVPGWRPDRSGDKAD